MRYSTPIIPPCNPSLISAPCPPNLPAGLERGGVSSCLPQEDCKSMALATARAARLTFQRVLLDGGVVGAARIEDSVAQRVPTDSVSNSSRFRISNYLIWTDTVRIYSRTWTSTMAGGAAKHGSVGSGRRH